MYSENKRKLRNLVNEIYDKVEDYVDAIKLFNDKTGGLARFVATQLVIFLQIRAISVGLTGFPNDENDISTGGVIFHLVCKIFWKQIVPLILAVVSYRNDKSLFRVLQDKSWVCVTTLGILEGFHRFFLLLLLPKPSDSVSWFDNPEFELSEAVGSEREDTSWMTLFIIVHTSKISARLTYQFFHRIVQIVFDKFDEGDGDDAMDLEYDDDIVEEDDNEILIIDENNNVVLQFILP